MVRNMRGGPLLRTAAFCLNVFILLNFAVVISGTDLMFHVPPGREECFFEDVEFNKTLYVDYSVVSSSQGELDINFQLSDTQSRPIVSEFRKTESRHEIPIAEKGFYKACFDNTFSHFSHKTVAFHISVDNDDDTNWSDYDDKNFQPDLQVYDVQVNDIKAIMERVRVHLNKIQGTQDTFRMLELRDRFIAESNFERVNFWSTLYMLILIFVGILQVLLLKAMFDEKSYIRRYISKFKR